jgi:hypothetical protein
MIDEHNSKDQGSAPGDISLRPEGHGQETTNPNPNTAKPKSYFQVTKEWFTHWRERRREKWKDTPPHERETVRLTRVIAFSTVCYTIVAAWTLYEIHSGSADTHNLAVAAGNQVTKIDQLAGQTGRTADAAEKANTQAVAAERPWVGIAEIDPKFIEPNVGVRLAIMAVNSGRRPAIAEMVAVAKAYKSFPKRPIYADLENKDMGSSRSLLMPGGFMALLHPFRIDSDQIADFSAKGQTEYLYGRITYVDLGTNISHTTHFCTMYIPKTKSFLTCPIYNDAD